MAVFNDETRNEMYDVTNLNNLPRLHVLAPLVCVVGPTEYVVSSPAPDGRSPTRAELTPLNTVTGIDTVRDQWVTGTWERGTALGCCPALWTRPWCGPTYSSFHRFERAPLRRHRGPVFGSSSAAQYTDTSLNKRLVQLISVRELFS